MSIHVFLLPNRGDRVGISILPWKDIFNFRSGFGRGVSKTHFYFLISLLFHRWFNKLNVLVSARQGLSLGPRLSSQDPG